MAASSPRFIAPQLATLVDQVPVGEDWVFEVKYDGYRLEAIVDGEDVRLFTRRGNDWTARFPTIARRLRRFPAGSATLDGELVSLDRSGRSAFNRLQQQLDAGDDGDLTFFVFDLLALGGTDVRDRPLTERWDLLQRLLRKARATGTGHVRLGQRLTGAPEALIRAACQLRLEGIVGKRADAPYASGRNRNWVKVKCGHRQEFVVVGFTPPRNSRVGVGSLLLGVHDRTGLRYAGRVGSGIPNALLRTLLQRLERLERKTMILSARPAGIPPGTRWVQPSLVVEVGFTEWTADGLLRHPVFEGMREDKPANEVQREEPAMTQTRKRPPGAPAEHDAMVAGVRITHPDRVVFPEGGITKVELAQHFERVASLMLPHVAGRPLSLVRCPEGSAHECFFQKHWTGTRPPSIDTVAIRQSDGKKHPHVMVHDVEGLVTLVQWGVVEIHPWGARSDNPDLPDRIIFDLDPGPGVRWEEIREAALGVQALLEALGLDCWLKTSGGKGLHVAIAVARRSTWDEVSTFARAIAEHMQREFPDRFIAKASKSARKGVIFVDWLRNTRGATAIAPWSTRARANAGVSVPLSWPQLRTITSGDQFTLRTVQRGRPRTDPWATMLAARQVLSKAILRRLQ